MARRPSPWYWPERNGWYTILNDKRHHLADHPENAPPPKKRNGKWVVPQDVDKVFHELLAKPPEKSIAPVEGLAIIEVFDKFLDWCKTHKAARTYNWYHDHIQDFVKHAGAEGASCADLTQTQRFNPAESWLDDAVVNQDFLTRRLEGQVQTTPTCGLVSDWLDHLRAED